MRSSKITINKNKKDLYLGIFFLVLLILLVWYIGNKNETFSIFKLFDNTPITGYWSWTWDGQGSGNPPNVCDIGILFSGEVPTEAIKNLINRSNDLTSREKYLNLGGGDEKTGIWQKTDFDYINNNLSNIKSKGWTGVCFDIEACPPGVSFVKDFADSFAKCKQAGLKVLVTTSHTLPYACKTGPGQGMDLVNAWINDPNIDYISPQLYSNTDDLEPTDLSILKNSKAKIVPSVQLESDWDKIQNLGIKPAGYIAWRRTGKAKESGGCGASWSDALARCPNTQKCFTDGDCSGGLKCYAKAWCNMCGKDWTDAKNTCSYTERCNDNDSQCPQGKKCFQNIDCVKPPGTVNLCGTNWNTVNCSTSVKCPNGTDGECPSGQKCFGNNKC